MFPDFLDEPVDIVARRLLGCELIRTFSADTDAEAGIGRLEIARVRIVETEAYDQNDIASHSFHGKSQRNRALFGPAGRAYIYFTYGMHYCFNVTAESSGFGAGVLIRACEPVEGEELLLKHRPHVGIDLLNGPAKLCQALGIDAALYGHDLQEDPLRLAFGHLREGESIQTTTRIGVSKGADTLRRFIIPENPYVSKASRRSIDPAAQSTRSMNPPIIHSEENGKHSELFL